MRDESVLAFTMSGLSVDPILLIHGWDCDHRTLSCQARHFAHSYRVVSVGLRGHGQSASSSNDYSTAKFSGDIEWLCRQLGIQNAVLIGHSMGGAVAIETAYRHPGSVRLW